MLVQSDMFADILYRRTDFSFSFPETMRHTIIRDNKQQISRWANVSSDGLFFLTVCKRGEENGINFPGS